MKRLALTIALAACSEPAPSAGVRAREAFVRDLAVREGLVAAWQLGNRSDLRFEDDLSATLTSFSSARSPRWAWACT